MRPTDRKKRAESVQLQAAECLREATKKIDALEQQNAFLEGVRVQQRAMIEDLNDGIERIARLSIKADYYRCACYPLTIIADRYGGSYSGGLYTAWNLDRDCVPAEIEADDATCATYWLCDDRPAGRGNTPDKAVADLLRRLEND